MRFFFATVLLSLLFVLASAKSVREFCGNAKCPIGPRIISCHKSTCFTDGLEKGRVYSLYKSTGKVPYASSWSPVKSHVQLLDIRSIAHFSNGAIAVADRVSGVHYGKDGVMGLSLKPAFKAGSIYQVFSLHVYSGSSQEVAIGCGMQKSSTMMYIIRVGSDGVATATPRSSDFYNLYGYPNSLHALSSSSFIIAAGGNRGATEGGGIIRTVDGGVTFTRAFFPKDVDLHFLKCNRIATLCAALGQDTTHFVVYLSFMHGIKWERKFSLSKEFVRTSEEFSLTVLESGTIVVGLFRELVKTGDYLIYSSKDKGSSWESQRIRAGRVQGIAAVSSTTAVVPGATVTNQGVFTEYTP